jgi:glycyl-tRNA synthetase beta chain
VKHQTLPLLVEIGCEEIPARFLTDAARQFGRKLQQALEDARLIEGQPQEKHEDVGASTLVVEVSPEPRVPSPRVYWTPRRLVAHIRRVRPRQPDRVEVITGPPVRVAFDPAGKPTRAAESFALKNQVPVTDLVREATPKGDYVAIKRTVPGRAARELLREIVPAAALGIDWPKSMVWLGKQSPHFIRPIRWILALLGEEKSASVVPFEMAGVRSGNRTFGHRSYSHRPISVSGVKDYRLKLLGARVEFDPEARRKAIAGQLKVLLEKQNLAAMEDSDLEDWIVNSTEWPQALLGEFDPRFLALPKEILVAVMRDHQKYFAVEDRKGKLQPRFVAVINLDSDPKGTIRSGHERVLLARFRDAEFFWQADQHRPLRERTELLKNVTYQAELGTYAEKAARMIALAHGIAELAAAAGMKPDTEAAVAAAKLAKCDLTTQMVQEFPELQGVVGGLYARAQGEDEEVTQAIYDHYRPMGAEDAVPRTLAGAIVSLADKVDAVAGGFALGKEPSGSSDPFGLRRQGNGIIKVLLEFALPIALRPVIERALVQLDVRWQRPREEVLERVMQFLGDRLAFYLESVRGLRLETVRAVLAAGWEVPCDASARARVLEGIRGSDDFRALTAAAKRIKNILSKSAASSDWSPGEVDAAMLREIAEKSLFERFREIEEKSSGRAKAGDYGTALRLIAGLRPAVDLFFDKVLVMAEDRALRQNRLRLLAALDGLFSGIAHFALMAGDAK